MVTRSCTDPTYVRRGIKQIDWWGLCYLVHRVSCIQVMLDKGERLDWFHSELINALTIVVRSRAAVHHPGVADGRAGGGVLRVLNNRTFAVAYRSSRQ